jgi:hypothetical protein
MARHGFGHPAGAAAADRDLQGAITVGLFGLDLGDPIGFDLDQRDGIETPSSVNTRVIPALRPMSPIAILINLSIDKGQRRGRLPLMAQMGFCG